MAILYTCLLRWSLAGGQDRLLRGSWIVNSETNTVPGRTRVHCHGRGKGNSWQRDKHITRKNQPFASGACKSRRPARCAGAYRRGPWGASCRSEGTVRMRLGRVWEEWATRSGAPPSGSRLLLGGQTAAASATVRQLATRQSDEGSCWCDRKRRRGRGASGADDAHETRRQQVRQWGWRRVGSRRMYVSAQKQPQ